MARQRTTGMTAIAVVNILFGGLGIVDGLYLGLGFLAHMYELLRLGIFEIPIGRLAFSLLILATGIIGLVAGIGLLLLRRWARVLSLVYGGLLTSSAIASFIALPIIGTLGTHGLGEIDAYGLLRLIIFSAIYVVVPVPYSLILWIMFCKPARKTAFAKDSDEPPRLDGLS